MNIAQPVSAHVKSVEFSFFEPNEIKKMSVLKISNPQIFDTLDHPTTNGLYDPHLGPHDKKTLCKTCALDQNSCPGHFGHIELSVPCYNPITFPLMYRLLKGICHYCHHLRLSELRTHLYAAKLKLIHAGMLVEASSLDMILSFKQMKDDENESEQKPVEGTAAIINKIDDFVKESFKNKTIKMFTKTTLIIDALRKLEKEFLAAIPPHTCQNCGGASPKYRKEGLTKIFEKPLPASTRNTMLAKGLSRAKLFADAPNIEDFDQDIYVSPITIKTHFKLLWEKESVILDLMYGNVRNNHRISSPEMFFLDMVAVTPSKFRPVSKLGDLMFEHPQNIYLVEILKANLDIQDIQALEQSWLDANGDLDSSEIEAKKREYLKRTVESWIKLQDSINNLLDSSKAPLGVNGKAAPPGIRQLLEKKEGLFRKHMMGKRVNYACRSVISPDPYIETNEIGIPPVFAKKLTYPEAVTPHNFAKLRECVVNGPETWPGATHVQNEDGSLIALSAFDEQGRSAIANQLLTPLIQKNQAGTCKIELILAHQFKNTNKKVYRHLRNGDFLLLNRQPTLHKPSIMAHTARVLPGERTIRMHYANCNTYNADFDGDEMNAHFPQNEIARAEAMIIARTDQQYLVPTDGGVLRGLIQDHVDAGVDMCSRDSFFTREEYIQLVYAGLREASSSSSVGNGNIEKHVIIGDNGRIQTHMPTIIKPFPLWTGKQIISTILENLTPAGVEQLNLISKSKIPAKQWGPTAPEEDVVLFMDGKLLTGILDKSQFGASGNGLVHAVYEIYGAPYASKLLSVLGRLFTAYLQKVGFSCRMDDLLLTREGNEARRNLIDTNSNMGTIVAKEFCGEEISLRLKLELEKVLRSSDKMAALDSAMKSKTNKVTSEIISTCIPDKLFKLFPRNNMQVMTVSGAKGSSVNVSQISCLLGQQELEGKRVPTMVSGKTLPSFQPYDPSSRAGGYITGRFLTGIKPQEYYFHCMAGREGLIDTAVKTSRSGYLQRCLIKGLEGIQVNYDNTVRDSDGSVLQFRYGEDSLDVCKQTTLKKFDFNALNYRALMKRYDPQRIDGKVDEKSAHKYCKKQKGNPNSDPVLSVFEPSSYIGAVSDRFKELLDDYLALNKAKLIKTKQNPPERSSWSGNLVTQTQFKTLMELKYMFSLVEPGESVGLLAAQSIGEPSTQMTLNTFHFAGFGAKNVTLGIPRLREIIMTASSSIKTPLMTLPLLDHVSASEKEQLCEQISKLVLSQIMKKVTVTETLSSRVSGRPRRKIFKVLMEFWEQKHYKKQYSIDAKHLNKLIENQFIYALERAISKLLKSSSREKDNIVDDIGVGVKERVQALRVGQEEEAQPSLRAAETAEASESDPESDEEGDGDATTARNRSKKMQQSTYDEDDEEKSDEQIDDPETDEPEIAEKLILDSKYVTGMTFDPSNNTCELTLDFPADTKKLLMVALIESVCNKLVVHQVKGIERCFPQPNDSENDQSVKIGTEGCNLRGMWDYQDKINIDKIYTNDISAILDTYGVEAARCAITQEIASVFGVYGIDVDTRHLSLIGDYMTFEGGYKPFNRIGMNSHTSPFAQMSYESTTNFLTATTLAGDCDLLDSPSARIVMGQVVKSGTGSFDVVQSLS